MCTALRIVGSDEPSVMRVLVLPFRKYRHAMRSITASLLLFLQAKVDRPDTASRHPFSQVPAPPISDVMWPALRMEDFRVPKSVDCW